MFVKVVVVFLVMVGAALAFPHAPVQQPYYEQQPLMPYEFGFGVQDKYSGQNFGQRERSDGRAVVGSYSVDLPDGRRQTVNYKADKYQGFVADVSYTGQAHHPYH
ncbi:cuticle protein 8-like [Panulirus ornatus]|uniref:cuticle protein 8-like n=1 Tax=Panulirus ornatus TaxID=150431 RepID=UPI003A87B160